jgi:hypothetical protein
MTNQFLKISTRLLKVSALAWLLCGAPNTALAEVCQGFGPQAPRDIDNPAGENKSIFSFAPNFQEMNLCNIHFHKQAEHKARDFSLFAGDIEHGGYRCRATFSLSKAELQPLQVNHCTNIGPGDTVEFHWVYTSCEVEPGEGLESCFADACSNPNLRVETQVFLVVNDPKKALDFMKFSYQGNIVDGYHQAKSLPSGTGTPVEFLGSTTGSSFSESVCSPFQVSWSVRPRCAKVDIASLSAWCEDNIFHEEHAHGVRQLVVNPELLSTIE